MRSVIAATLLIGLGFPAPAAAQGWYVKFDGIDGSVEARVIAPRNYLEQIRNGTLKELELELPAGAVNDEIARTNAGSRRLDAFTLRVPQQNAAYLEWKLKNATITSYSMSAGDKFSRVKVHFHWDQVDAQGKIEIGALKAGASEILNRDGGPGDGVPDLVAGAGAHRARLSSQTSLQSLTGSVGASEPIAIEVRRGSQLERLLRPAATGTTIPKLKLELFDAGGARVTASLSNVRVVGSRRGNSVGTEVMTLAYEGLDVEP